MDTKQLLTKAADAFTTDNPRGCVSTRDDAPEWLRDAIREAHAGNPPCDWTYAACQSFFDRFGSFGDQIGGIIGRAIAEWADSEVSPYNSQRYRWLSEASGAEDACDEAEADGLCGDSAALADRVGAGWYVWASAIGYALWSAVEATATE